MRRTVERRTIIERRTPAGILIPSASEVDACEQRTSAPGAVEFRAAGADDGPDGADFWGVALPWMTLDSYGTRFRADAFRDGGVDADPYAFLWMHDPWTVQGTLSAEARPEGLWIEGVYDDTPEGTAARSRAKSGSARALSVGFERLGDEDNEDGTVTITKARLVEVSQVTARMEAVPGAGLAGVRRHVRESQRDGGMDGRPGQQRDARMPDPALMRARLLLSY